LGSRFRTGVAGCSGGEYQMWIFSAGHEKHWVPGSWGYLGNFELKRIWIE